MIAVSPKPALSSRTILLNAGLLLITLNEALPLLTEYQSVLAISDTGYKRIVFGVAVANIVLRRLTAQPVVFRPGRAAPNAAPQVSGDDEDEYEPTFA